MPQLECPGTGLPLMPVSPIPRSSAGSADWCPPEAGLPLLALCAGFLSSRSRREAGVEEWPWVPGTRQSCALSPPGQLLAFFQLLFKRSLFWELTRASPIVPSRTHPPAPGNAAVPERLEALKYQRIKKPKKSSKGSSKSKKRSGKC